MDSMLTLKDFTRMVDGSWYTIIGCGGDLNEWKDGYSGMLTEAGIPSPSEWIDFTGADYNRCFAAQYGMELTGDNRYPDDLHFLAFPVVGLPGDAVCKLAMFKLRMGDRWLDDVVSNDLRREEEKEA